MALDRVVVDSSVFIAFYWEKDTQHEAAVRIMEELAGATLIVHPYVVQEVATVLTKKLGLVSAKKFLKDIVESSNVDIPWVYVKADIGGFNSISRPMSFTDAALVRFAKAGNVQLITFDRVMLSLFRSS